MFRRVSYSLHDENGNLVQEYFKSNWIGDGCEFPLKGGSVGDIPTVKITEMLLVVREMLLHHYEMDTCELTFTGHCVSKLEGYYTRLLVQAKF